jgi:ElaB/YqjD/DUF883 family membrane-anchored ribosome-binding protein
MAATSTVDGIDTLKADLNNASRASLDAARASAADLGKAAAHAAEAAREGVHGAKAFAHDTYEQAKHAATETADSLKHVIARNPMASVGIAAGLGILIGLVVFRPRS